MVRTPAGEDQIVSCDECDYAANMEKATSKLDEVPGSFAEAWQAAAGAHTGTEDD